jgi:uncharacterized protein YaiE (UPF0345 family)
MRKTLILLGLVMVVGLGSLVFAGTTDTIDLKVTPISNVSVNIIDGSYNFGTVALYNTTTESTALQVKNDGSVQASWQHKAGNASTWNLVYAGVVASTDQFRLWAEVSATKPTFEEADKVTTTNANLTSGSAIPVGTTKNLWIKLEMPYAVTGAGGNEEHTSIYTITATAD